MSEYLYHMKADETAGDILKWILIIYVACAMSLRVAQNIRILC